MTYHQSMTAIVCYRTQIGFCMRGTKRGVIREMPFPTLLVLGSERMITENVANVNELARLAPKLRRSAVHPSPASAKRQSKPKPGCLDQPATGLQTCASFPLGREIDPGAA